MPESQRGQAHKWVITGTVLVGTLMAVLDASIVNVALPAMRGTLGATVEEITWVVTGYILSSVIVMPAIALASARMGRRRFYVMNIVIFTVASALCGMARTMPLMVLFRVFQGVGGGVLMTVSQAILRETFPAEEQGLAMGIYGLGVVLAPLSSGNRSQPMERQQVRRRMAEATRMSPDAGLSTGKGSRNGRYTRWVFFR